MLILKGLAELEIEKTVPLAVLDVYLKNINELLNYIYLEIEKSLLKHTVKQNWKI